ncbi:uncharacterized protein BYT42DRAFT_609528 [Radiomyces spectabilis]|uniref:uncharacterized protein n=1 Tax=Radiomyces spectabilis TaxID=64574 RepID=UPI00222077D0|nr:uncharacterized protein BYT42DRAFT_609528 [Radiomyces spectabilis]KAI8393758.1 hypothetical protein BYT42DRAFT_609528 [Radiomyces spectabilis]
MTSTAPSLQDRLAVLIKHPQFYWWCGHVCVVCNAMLYFMSVMSLNANATYYKRAYLGALISYAVVVWNSVRAPKRWSMDIFRNENTQYLALAFYWYAYHPITVTLIPFSIFSIFHTFAYIRSTIIPVFFPATNRSTINKTCQAIKQLTDEYHEGAMQLAAYIEVVGIMGRLIVGVALFQTSILALIIFGHFLRLRYFLSPYTREAMHAAATHLDEWLLPPTADARIPSFISKIYCNIKGVIVRYGSVTTEHEE